MLLSSVIVKADMSENIALIDAFCHARSVQFVSANQK